MATRLNLRIFEVRNMRRLHSDGYPICRMQACFGVAQRTVSDVVHGRTHKRVRSVEECSTPHAFDSMGIEAIASVYRAKGYRGHGATRRLADKGQEAVAAMSTPARGR